MGLIYLFRRLVFVQVLLGIVAFCIAEQNPGMLLVAGALGALSWYVVEGPTGKPLPQWIIIPGAIGSVAWLLLDLYWQKGQVILAMGHFTMWLQILLLYARKSNREYGEILVLSLMQMIGASVLNTSLVYGLFLSIYAVLALFTLLLFHLKITSDEVLEQNQKAAPEDLVLPRPKAVVGPRHRWHFRSLALVIGVWCALIGSVVFLLIPRSGESHLNPGLSNPYSRNRQAGFSEEVTLDGAPLSTGSREAVLYVHLVRQGLPVVDPQYSFLLRGATLDEYRPHERKWVRSRRTGQDVQIPLRGEVTLAQLDDGAPTLDLDVVLRHPAHRHLFSFAELPITTIASGQINSVNFNTEDQNLATSQAYRGLLRYALRSPLTPPANLAQRYAEQSRHIDGLTLATQGGRRGLRDDGYAEGWADAREREKLTNLARQIITDAGQTWPLPRRKPAAEQAALDALAEYLRLNYRYELLSDTLGPDERPVSEFLFTSKAGHCELFAAALAALARCSGLPARLITGYRVSEFNGIGNYYVVRQRNAHAWAEVGLSSGQWVLVDPTPPDDVAQEHQPQDTWNLGLRHLYEHMEYLWSTTVVAYDSESQDELAGNLRASLRQTRDDTRWLRELAAWIKELPERWRLDSIGYTVMGFICFFIVLGVASLIQTLLNRHRRLVALQLTRLPRKQRKALARRLKWYLLMLDLLERHGYIRPNWQSPLDFSRELAQANPLRFDPVVELTEIFYEIRFGHREMDETRTERVRGHMRQLEAALARR